MHLSAGAQLGLLVLCAVISGAYIWRLGLIPALPRGSAASPSKGKSKGGGGMGAGGKGGFARDVSGVSAAIWFVAAAVTLLSITVSAQLAMSLPPEVHGTIGTLQRMAAVTTCAFGGGAVVGLLMMYFLSPRTGANAGMRFRLTDVSVGLLAILVLAPFLVLTAVGAEWFWTIVLHDKPPTAAHAGLVAFLREPTSPAAMLFAFTAITLTPLTEELVYRIFGQSAARSLLGDTPARVWLMVVCVSAVFAATHTSGGTVPWAAVPGLFVLALGMGLAFEHTKRPGVPITMHAAFNAANLAMAYYQHTHGG